ncbi:MAG: hypothetical protein V8R91_11345 [Butyricimonas faecihominis]
MPRVVFFVGGVVFLQEMKFGSDDANGKQAALAPGMGKAGCILVPGK